jgi:hypothetical protein
MTNENTYYTYYNTQIRVLNSKLLNLLFLSLFELYFIYKERDRRKFCVRSQFACKSSAPARKNFSGIPSNTNTYIHTRSFQLKSVHRAVLNPFQLSDATWHHWAGKG